MQTVKRLSVILTAAVVASLTAATPSFASNTTQLVVHFYGGGTQRPGQITASALGGSSAAAKALAHDSFGEVATFDFPDAGDDAHLGFTVSGDSVFPNDRRVVRATSGEAEVWVLDGDARAYQAPKQIAPTHVVRNDSKAYVAVEDLVGLLGLTYKYALNTYVFDGHAKNTTNILTIYRNRDYFEIDVAHNRIGSNVTGNMLNAYTDTVFNDIDGYYAGGRYYLSYGAIERLFQVRTLILDDGSSYILIPQVVAHGSLETADPATVGFDPAKLDAIDAYVQQQVDAGGPAVAFVVTKDGKTVKNSAYGYAKKYGTAVVDGQIQPAVLLPVDEREPATTDTLFDLASNSKMYATNYAIQRLVSEGRLDLNRTLQSFPGWENFRDNYTVYTGKWTVGGSGGITARRTGKQTITILDILHHNAGLIPDPEYPNLSSAGALWYQTDNPDDRTGIIDAVCKTPLMYAPRTTFAYSDVDFMILGLLVEQITGQRLDEYMQQEFYGPLGLDHTMFRPLDHGIAPEQVAATELNGNTRDGHVSFGTLPGGTPVPMRHYTLQGEVHDEKAYYSMAGIAGHAGLFSDTADMAVLTQLMLNGGIYGDKQYFSQEVVNQFTAPFSLNPATVDSSTIALGWRVHSKSAAAYYYFNWGPSRESYGHQGWTGTLTVIDPLTQMTVTVLTNMRHSPVVSPPNGFAGASFPVSDLVPIVARVYNALNGQSEQFSPLASVRSVNDVTVPAGSSKADALAALPATTTITDKNDVEHVVSLDWSISDYNGSFPRDYSATGRFTLPATVLPPAPGGPGLEVSATVHVVLTADPWAASKAYAAGDLVEYGGTVWQASWWTQNQVPGDPYGPWQELRNAPDGTTVWTASRVFVAGDVAVYQGVRYRAKWWTRNQVPGDAYGPWQPIV
ncbi:penicillin binding protein PBP4B [Micromonospora sp. SL1-18]|uniref:penicillin binding protein PBP4B n=1 Tax=Micromonospora sp. SL1-18 TaxID=3399128 RepID=UPI003A4DF48C